MCLRPANCQFNPADKWSRMAIVYGQMDTFQDVDVHLTPRVPADCGWIVQVRTLSTWSCWRVKLSKALSGCQVRRFQKQKQIMAADAMPLAKRSVQSA
jgi:hypothetical protein